MEALYTFYKIRPIVLIDEYDDPIIEAHKGNFRKEFTNFYASFLTKALKGNQHLGQALLTGIQRVAKESIFSKLNNTQLSDNRLKNMFDALINGNMDEFLTIYQKLVLESTSFHDAKENSYHMLMLGMVMHLRELYDITSNIESGHGRSDLIMKSKDAKRSHIIIEFVRHVSPQVKNHEKGDCKVKLETSQEGDTLKIKTFIQDNCLTDEWNESRQVELKHSH